MVSRSTQKQAQEYKEKKVQFFKEFVENADDVEGSARQKKHPRQPAAASASASDELLKVDHCCHNCYCHIHGKNIINLGE